MSEAIVAGHYARSGLANAILAALQSAGKDLTALTPSDLASADAFHVRGREATQELAERIQLSAQHRVLDVGCGIGGSARYLASRFGCAVTGVDLSPDYCAAAKVLNERVGLGDRISIQQGSALTLPFPAESFDVVWTEHAQMNIADKPVLNRELRRVLRPSGCLVFHDIFAGPNGPVHFPVPWASEASISFLVPSESALQIVTAAGFHARVWEDVTEKARTWFGQAAERAKTSPPSPIGLHLLMGPSARTKVENLARNIVEARIVLIQAVFAASETRSSSPTP